MDQVQGQVSSMEVRNLFWYIESSRRTYKMVVSRGQKKPVLNAHLQACACKRVLVSACL